MMDAQEFTTLAKAHMDMIYRLAFSQLHSGSDADDVTQNVLLALFQSDKTFKSDAHLRHWLVRVTLNECRKHWRSPWTRTEDIETYAVTLPFEDAHSEGLFRAIMALEKPLRTVVVLHYCDGYTIAELSEMLHIPPGTVGTRLMRARRKLREYLKEAD